ncbi:MAG: flagellin [Magnetospirillum gryphiswaldense]|nr:flagellin [Magnetospirillum gryphiswaldense]
MERVSTAGLGQALLRSAMTVQARLAEKQSAQSSGLTQETYAAMGSSAGKLISMESQLSTLQGRSDSTQTALDRAQSMSDAVGSMVDLMSDLRSTLSSMTTQTSDSVDYNQVGQTLLEDLATLMNLQVDGRYLFGGGETTAAPVDVSLLTVQTTSPTTADTAYYLGDDAVQSVKVTDTATVDYGVNANESGFEKALRAANMLANIDAGDEDAIAEAYDLATEAMDELLAAQGRLGVNAGRLESWLERQDTAASLMSERISDVKAVDTAQVAVEISQYETTLEASYAVLGKLNGLHLLDYL